MTPTYRVVFVCLGNICRSPMAEVVFRAMLEEQGLDHLVEVSSAGTGDWHIGERADRRTVEALAGLGYDAGGHRARQFDAGWFDDHDLVVALDRHNLDDLRRIAPPDRHDDVRLLRSFDAGAAGDDLDVPDPYYGGPDGFANALDLVQRSCRGLLEYVRAEVGG